jgi:hypothetical protein
MTLINALKKARELLEGEAKGGLVEIHKKGAHRYEPWKTMKDPTKFEEGNDGITLEDVDNKFRVHF